MNALQEARNFLDQYQDRINKDFRYGDITDRAHYEDAAFKQGMLNAAIAQTEAAEHQARAMEKISHMLEGYVALYLDASIMSVVDKRMAKILKDASEPDPHEWGKDTDEEAEARTDYADPLN